MKKDEIVINALKETACHADVNELVKSPFIQDSKISTPTLYRKLNKLTQMGKIKKIIGLNDSAHYDHNTFDHYHFICSKCGKILDIMPDENHDIIEHAKRGTNLIIEHCEVTFSGLCPECAHEVKNNKEEI